MKKVVYLHQYFCKPTMNGGVRSYEFAKRLAADGYDVHVVTSDRVNRFKGWRTESLDGFSVHWVSVAYANGFGFFARVLAFLKFSMLATFKLISLRADVNYVTSTPLTVAIPALFSRLFAGVPYVFEVRDLWPEVPVQLGVIKNKLIIWGAKKLEYFAYHYSEAVVALSPDMSAGVISAGIERNKVVEIPNASDVEVLRRGRDAFVCEFWLCHGIDINSKKVVVYTGTLGRVNNVGYLVDIAYEALGFERASDLVFVVFGEGAEKAPIVEKAKELGVLGNNFFIFDPVSKKDLALVLAGVSLSLSLVDNIPVLWGNSANKFFDAFAAGVPVAINHGGWQADVISKYECGLVLDLSTKKALLELVEFLDDPQRFDLAKERSRKLGDNVYDRNVLYCSFKSVVDAALDRN